MDSIQNMKASRWAFFAELIAVAGLLWIGATAVQAQSPAPPVPATSPDTPDTPDEASSNRAAIVSPTPSPSADDGGSSGTEGPAEDVLRDQQLSISGRYSRFERMLSQMADILGREDPERADLLRRAIGKGREQRIGDRIDGVVQLLESREFGTAVEEQQQVTAGLAELLKLLQSEDRRSSVEKERERLNNLLKDVRNLIAEQRSARSANQNSPAPSNAAPQQQKAIDKADSTIEQIHKDDAEKAASSEESDGASSSDAESSEAESSPGADPSKDPLKDQPSDGQPSGRDPKSSEKDSGEKKPSDRDQGEKEPGEKEPGEKVPTEAEPGSPDAAPSDQPAQPQQSSPQQSEQNSRSPQDSAEGSPSPPSSSSAPPSPSSSDEQKQQTPGREQIEAARKLMQQALDQLRQQQKQAALDKQDEAIVELQQAAEKLEEMLRQLREEEKEMLLAALEARYQRMLALQTQIHEGTLELAATPKDNWLDQYFGRCRELSQQQQELTGECAQTVNLLQEDGTSVSILLAMEDIESDMAHIAEYLRESRVDTLTQSVQTDVIEALKELIEATQKEMQEMKSEQRQQQQQNSDNAQKPPLVELMAEIKVLRSLQMRVNRRTKQVDTLIQEVPATEQQDLLEQLTELADRQQRLIQSAAELSRQMQR